VTNLIKEVARCFGAPPAAVIVRRGETEMDYDNTNRGVLFNEIDKKPGDNDRDYGGSININGEEFWLSGWIKTSKKGMKFMSLSVKAKVEKQAEAAAGKPVSFDDEVPFAPEWR
jgi:hypothetical protein